MDDAEKIVLNYLKLNRSDMQVSVSSCKMTGSIWVVKGALTVVGSSLQSETFVIEVSSYGILLSKEFTPVKGPSFTAGISR